MFYFLLMDAYIYDELQCRGTGMRVYSFLLYSTNFHFFLFILSLCPSPKCSLLCVQYFSEECDVSSLSEFKVAMENRMKI